MNSLGAALTPRDLQQLSQREAGRPALPGRRLATLALAGGALGLAGCGSTNLQDYAGLQPTFDLAAYFQGQTRGWGMVRDRSGKVLRYFIVDIEGRFEGDQGSLNENFVWSDGERENRVWQLKKTGPQSWTGTTADVVGIATGEAVGNILRWQYVFTISVDGRKIDMDFDDWMILVDDETLLNQAKFSKFGIHLGEVVLSFKKL